MRYPYDNHPARPAALTGKSNDVNMILLNKAGKKIILDIGSNELPWSEKCPKAGDPDCTCSYCSFVIPGDEVPIELYHICDLPDCPDKDKEAWLHLHCLRLLMR